MIWVLLIAFVIGGALYYVLHLDFEIGTGFSEAKKNVREAKYTVVKKETEYKKLK